MRTRALILATVALMAVANGAPLYESQLIFERPTSDAPFHAHASCLVECPNGDLRAVWYETGAALPASYYSESRDRSDDVRIGGSRKARAAKAWEKPFVMADTFGVSDNNPCMVIDNQKRLLLFYPTLTGAPDWPWGSAVLQYSVSTNYSKPGPPVWSKQNILIPHVQGVKEVVESSLAAIPDNFPPDKVEQFRKDFAARLNNVAYYRLGWMPRAHPLLRSDGAVLLPLSNENFYVAAMAVTSDGGDTWTYSKPVSQTGITQPTLAEFPDKSIVAFFRNTGKEHRIKRSESSDGGITWSAVTLTDRPHPGAGIEARVLKSGLLLLIYNDVDKAPRNKLAVSLSTDRGETWQWTRHLEDSPDGRFDYPSIVQGKDGTLHATYTLDAKTIKYAHFNEEWIKAGDPAK
ncbi:MAG: exo-alpha-sialidase [Candidatus Hydrogenedentes bacterium]|nr:exo-alpha-sialidase [Candidatus Hydrogenedentota bacterium]